MGRPGRLEGNRVVKVSVAPFKMPDPESIQFSGWSHRHNGQDAPLAEELEHWDYQTRLVLSGFLKVDEPSTLNNCELAPESRLAVLVTAQSQATRTELQLCLVDLPKGWNDAYALTVEVPGIHFSRRLTLRTQVVVSRSCPLSDVAPSLDGSILWSHEQKTYLQGSGAQFPTYAEDFTITRPHYSGAGWIIDIDTSDLGAHFLSNIRIVLNTGLRSIQKLLAGSDDSDSVRLQKMIDYDVSRRILVAALGAPEVWSLDPDFDDLSVAGGLRSAVAALFPETPVEYLAHDLDGKLGELEARLQDRRGVFT